jgi:uncharacterized protein (DUF924 family)
MLERAARGEFASWAASPKRRLALILLFDQVPRNAYRGTAAAFAFDREALALTVEGMQLAADAALDPIERIFFYLPLEHAESLEAQDAAVAAFARLASEAPEEVARLLRILRQVRAQASRHHREVRQVSRIATACWSARAPRPSASGWPPAPTTSGSSDRAAGARHHLVGVVGLDEAPGDFGESGLDAALEAFSSSTAWSMLIPGVMRTLIASITCGPSCKVMALSSFFDALVGLDVLRDGLLQVFLGGTADDESLDAHRDEHRHDDEHHADHDGSERVVNRDCR